jgi:hypothetical protein
MARPGRVASRRVEQPQPAGEFHAYITDANARLFRCRFVKDYKGSMSTVIQTTRKDVLLL